MTEPVRGHRVGVLEHRGPAGMDRRVGAVEDRRGGMQPDPGMAVFEIIVKEEFVGPGDRVLAGAKPSRVGVVVLRGLERRLAVIPNSE